jgi:hypothetical protein
MSLMPLPPVLFRMVLPTIQPLERSVIRIPSKVLLSIKFGFTEAASLVLENPIRAVEPS